MFISLFEWLYLVSAFAAAWTLVLVGFLFVFTRKRFIKWTVRWSNKITSMMLEEDEDEEEP